MQVALVLCLVMIVFLSATVIRAAAEVERLSRRLRDYEYAEEPTVTITLEDQVVPVMEIVDMKRKKRTVLWLN